MTAYPYLARLREERRAYNMRTADRVVPATFRGPARGESDAERADFAERCLEHERIQLRKTVEILRRVERERDELAAELTRRGGK